MRNVVAYCRVSTDKQAGEDRFGLDAQKEQIMEYCAKHDMQISDWYIDKGESGAKESRPQLDLLIYGDIKNPPVEAVVVAKSDRLSRDINLYFYYKQLLHKKGMSLVSLAEDFGIAGPMAPILEAYVIFAAEMERANITSRTSAGRKIKSAQGGYSGGKPPYGYYVNNKRLCIVESEAEVIREIFTLREAGTTLEDICAIMKDKGVKTRTGGPMAQSTVLYMLNNQKLYEGYYRYKGMEDWVEGQHDAILTR